MAEHDNGLAQTVVNALQESGYRSAVAATAADARRMLSTQPFDLIIIEPTLRGSDDGMSLIKEFFAANSLPLIIISERSRPIHKIIGLEIGADDYVVKPFDADELVARVGAVLRRIQRSTVPLGREPATKSADAPFEFDGWVFDLAQRELKDVAGAHVPLTSTEIDLLGIFVRNPRIPVSRLSIIEQLGKHADTPSIRNIDVLIFKLRRKIEMDGPNRIKTVRGSGYMFTPHVRYL